ncbi:MAG TPA: hypothetical protein VD864_04215, partial [Nocardioides sp.]|nr:hypothetical protein [Nocardioides sp.]
MACVARELENHRRATIEGLAYVLDLPVGAVADALNILRKRGVAQRNRDDSYSPKIAVIHSGVSCCDQHKPEGCCDPADCGPCCLDCPTCPVLARQRIQQVAEIRRLLDGR